MTSHRISVETLISLGTCEVAGDEARHAVRVKRLEAGEAVELLDGRGHIGSGRVAEIKKLKDEWRIWVDVESVRDVAATKPAIEVCSAAPKGDRLSEMIDGLAQVGAAAWRYLATERAVSDPPRVDRAQRIAVEASKQSGRAWHMEIRPPVSFADAVTGAGIVLADASGVEFKARGDETRLLIGPEGGWTKAELDAARAAGVRVCKFGVHTMRIETAAIVATGIMMT